MTIKITTPKDYLIIESVKGNKIPVGTNIFCGICGGLCGITKRSLTFPFEKPDFLQGLKKRTIITTEKMWLKHKTCGKELFVMKTDWAFITLDKFNEFQNETGNKPAKQLSN